MKILLVSLSVAIFFPGLVQAQGELPAEVESEQKVEAEQKAEKCEKPDLNLTNIQSLAKAVTQENQNLCDQKSISSIEKIPPISFGVWGAKAKMKSLVDSINEKQESFLQDSSGCPEGCQKISTPVIEVSTRPAEFTADEKCPAQPTEIEYDAGVIKSNGAAVKNSHLEKSFSKKVVVVNAMILQ